MYLIVFIIGMGVGMYIDSHHAQKVADLEATIKAEIQKLFPKT